MRYPGIVLLRAGLLMVGAALLGGLCVAVYAVATGADGILEGHIVGEKEALKQVVLYPIAAGVAGSILALPGLTLSYLGNSALERHRGESIPSA